MRRDKAMTDPLIPPARAGRVPLRLLAWLAAAALIATPWVAMRMNAEGVNWTALDFVFASAVLFGALAAYELIQMFVRRPRHRLAVAGVLLLGVVAIWGWAVA